MLPFESLLGIDVMYECKRKLSLILLCRLIVDYFSIFNDEIDALNVINYTSNWLRFRTNDTFKYCYYLGVCSRHIYRTNTL